MGREGEQSKEYAGRGSKERRRQAERTLNGLRAEWCAERERQRERARLTGAAPSLSCVISFAGMSA